VNIKKIEHMWKIATDNPNHDTNWFDSSVVKFANLVAAAEREACEMAVEDIARKYQKLHHASLENIADECAAAIRERNQA
jgi:hypothetical protein